MTNGFEVMLSSGNDSVRDEVGIDTADRKAKLTLTTQSEFWFGGTAKDCPNL